MSSTFWSVKFLLHFLLLSLVCIKFYLPTRQIIIWHSSHKVVHCLAYWFIRLYHSFMWLDEVEVLSHLFVLKIDQLIIYFTASNNIRMLCPGLTWQRLRRSGDCHCDTWFRSEEKSRWRAETCHHLRGTKHLGWREARNI